MDASVAKEQSRTVAGASFGNPRWTDIVLAAVIPAVLGVCLVLWLDNAHLNTNNGIWKSIQLEPWKIDLSAAPFDRSNYLYFPLMAVLCRGLDLLGIHSGETWRQVALINCLFAGVAVAAINWMVQRLTGRRDLAAVAAVLHFGSAFFLSLALSDEDIMPSYTFVLLAMAMAAVWFAAPTTAEIILVAVVFTTGWLSEWRLLFPALPPLVLALAFSKGSLSQALGRILLFAVAVIGAAWIAAFLSRGHPGAEGLLGLLWTGKGVHTGWAGFSAEKIGWIVYGMGEYLLGGRSWWFRDAHVAEWIGAFVVEISLLALLCVVLLRNLHDRTLRNVGVIFVGTLLAGQFMNAYSQAQDPQMQLNVMAWIPISVVIAAWRLPARIWPVIAGSFCAAAVLLAYNVQVFARSKGLDSEAQAELQGLYQLTDPDRTVFLYASWEPIVSWQFLAGGHRWDGACDLSPAPVRHPRFKWISLYGPLLQHQAVASDQYASDLRAQIDCAFDKGYRVVAGRVMSYPEERFQLDLSLLNRSDLAPVIYNIVHSFAVAPLGEPTPAAGYQLQQILKR